MRRCTGIWLIVVSFVLILAFCSCSSVEVRSTPEKKVGNGNGPPAHAKAYGYRRKHPSGVELVYESKSGVYVVVGFPNHYYCDSNDLFYRVGPNGWQASAGVDSGWTYVTENSLPQGLRGDKKGNGRLMPLASAKNAKK